MFESQYLWTAACLMLLSCSCYCRHDIDVSTIIDFTNFHLSYCKNSQLCTAGSDDTLGGKSCCQMCSCEQECEEDDSCCPDILLRGSIGSTTEKNNIGHVQESDVIGNTTERDVIGNAREHGVIGNAAESNEIIGNTTERDIIGNATERDVIRNTSESDVIGNTAERYVIDNTTERHVIGNSTERDVIGKAIERDVITIAKERTIFNNSYKLEIHDNARDGIAFGNITEIDLIGRATELVDVANTMNFRNNTKTKSYTTDFRNTEDILSFENRVYGCVETKLSSRDIWTPSPRMRSAYQMVTQCPNHYSANPSVIDRCTVSSDEYHKGMNVSNSHEWEDLINIVTPVTSMSSLITYRNIYCLVCHENIAENAFVRWRAFLYGMFEGCSYFGGPFETFANTFELSCIIIMIPPESILPFIPKKCNPSDIKTCPIETQSRLDLFCRSFNLPVREGLAGGKYVIYQNIACYICNNNKTFVEKCWEHKLRNKDDYLELNVYHKPLRDVLLSDHQQNTSKTDSINGVGSSNSDFIENASALNPGAERLKNKTSTQQDMERLQKLASLYCDRKYEKCGEILCPVYFFQRDGECIPTFSSFKGLYFSFYIEVKTKRTLNKADLEIFFPVLYQIMLSFTGSFFREFSFGVWYSIEKDVLNNIVIVVSYISTRPDYLGALNMTDDFLQAMKNVKVRTSLGIDDLIYRLTDEYEYSSETMTDTRNYSPLNEYKKGAKLNGPLKEMKIVPAMGCYRIFLEEIVRSTLIPSKIQLISRVMVGISSKAIRYITCFEEAVLVSYNITDAYFFKGFAGNYKKVVLNIKDPGTVFGKTEDDIDNGSKGKGDNTEGRLQDKGENKSIFEAGSTNQNQAQFQFFGTREAAVTATAACFVLVLFLVRKYKKRISSHSNATVENVPLQHLPKF